jgi:hypothetical protein
MTEEVSQKDTVIYKIKITEIPENERSEVVEHIENKIKTEISKLKTDDSLNLGNVVYSIGFVSPKYQSENDVLKVYIEAICDNYDGLTKVTDKIFRDISTFRKEFYAPHTIQRTKDFGVKLTRSRPVWL